MERQPCRKGQAIGNLALELRRQLKANTDSRGGAEGGSHLKRANVETGISRRNPQFQHCVKREKQGPKLEGVNM